MALPEALHHLKNTEDCHQQPQCDTREPGPTSCTSPDMRRAHLRTCSSVTKPAMMSLHIYTVSMQRSLQCLHCLSLFGMFNHPFLLLDCVCRAGIWHQLSKHYYHYCCCCCTYLFLFLKRVRCVEKSYLTYPTALFNLSAVVVTRVRVKVNLYTEPKCRRCFYLEAATIMQSEVDRKVRRIFLSNIFQELE